MVTKGVETQQKQGTVGDNGSSKQKGEVQSPSSILRKQEFVEKQGPKPYLLLNKGVQPTEAVIKRMSEEAKARGRYVNLDDINMDKFKLEGIPLEGASVRNGHLYAINIIRSPLTDGDLTNAFLSKSIIYGDVLSGTDVYKTDFSYATLIGVPLSKAKNLAYAKFRLTRGVSKEDQKLIIELKSKLNTEVKLDSSLFFSD